jgi:hypothetical protein
MVAGGAMGGRLGAQTARAARAAEVDGTLRKLARNDGALRLALGEALDALARAHGHHDLGFSSLDAYAKERCGLGSGVVRKLRAMARHLSGLPRLRAALRDGVLGYSMVELLAKHATPRSEVFLIKLAQSSTVAEVRRALDAGGAGRGGPAGRRRKGCVIDAEVAWLYEQTRMLVEAEVGTRANDAVWEALLAEAAVELADHLPGEPADVPAPDDAASSSQGAVADRTDAANDFCAAVSGASGDDAHPSDAGTRDAHALDAHCVSLTRQLALRDLHIGDLGLDLGYYGFPCDEREYAEQVLGMSVSAFRAKRRLARRLGRFPELRHALEDGEIGMEAAALLVRVVTQESVQAWVDRARVRTVKHLAEEVRLAEVASRLTGGVPEGPPTAAQVEQMAEVERGVLGGQICHLTRAPMVDDPTVVQPRHMGRVRLWFRMRADLAHELERVGFAWKQAGCPDGDFVRFLCLTFWRAWGPMAQERDQVYGHIYARDRFRCASPTCERREVHAHHLVPRSLGGGEDSANLVALCEWCHLQGVHGVRSVRAAGPAPGLYWRTPVLEVRGREVAWRLRRACRAAP